MFSMLMWLGGCSSPNQKATTAIMKNDARQLDQALAAGADLGRALKSAVERRKEEAVRQL